MDGEATGQKLFSKKQNEERGDKGRSYYEFAWSVGVSRTNLTKQLKKVGIYGNKP